MKAFVKDNPIVFGFLLFVASMGVAAFLTIGLQIVGFSVDEDAILSRLVVGVALMVIFRSCFAWESSFSGLRYALPALAFPLWNLAYNPLGGAEVITASAIPEALVASLAPAVFEETIFRGITISKMRERGMGTLAMLFASAALFGAVHITNVVGMDLAGTLVQVIYAFVIGLLFGAVYLVSQDIVTVMAAHALIDFSSKLFATHPTSTGSLQIVAFVVLLVAEALYAVWLVWKAGDKR